MTTEGSIIRAGALKMIDEEIARGSRRNERGHIMQDPMIDVMLTRAREVANLDKYNKIPQVDFFMEEIGEFLQARSKANREKGSKEDMLNEAMDVMAAGLVYLITEGKTPKEIMEFMTYKYNRAINRYDESGEL